MFHWLEDSELSFGEPGYEERETIENGLLPAAADFSIWISFLNTSSNPPPDSSSDIIFLKMPLKTI
jgi:dihydroorotase